MIRKLKPVEYRIYCRNKNPKINKRRAQLPAGNLGTCFTLDVAKKHEQEVWYFKRH